MFAHAHRLEAWSALAVVALVAIFGVAMAGAAESPAVLIHGWMIALAAVWGLWKVTGRWSAPRTPAPEDYNDAPIRWGVAFMVGWGVFGFAMGVWIAAQLAWPALNFDTSYLNFGRLRPTHTTGVIFGFGGNALIATSFYVVQRTCRARLAGEITPWLIVFGYNLVVLLAITGYPLGLTQGKEYAEQPWYADLLLTVVWVAYILVFFATLARRREPHIYVANWYYLVFILIVAMLHIVNSAALPVSLGSGLSYSAYAGVQDAMTQWWYGHNAVGFLLTGGFLGMMYYFLPKAAGRPIYSYRMSIIGFWGITFFYMWNGAHHLHYTALPDWVQTLGMTMAVFLLIPSWIAAFNAFFTLNGAWHKVRTDPALRFMLVAICFYALSTFEGSFMSLKPVNALSHYTDWTIGHVHSGALGWVAFITFGSMYKMVPRIFDRPEVYSVRLEAWHFWLALSGTLIYVGSLWNGGITQGLMWRTYDENGQLAYAFIDTVEALHPYYAARTVGGLLYLLGFLIGTYNIWMTIRGPRAEAAMPGRAIPTPAE